MAVIVLEDAVNAATVQIKTATIPSVGSVFITLATLDYHSSASATPNPHSTVAVLTQLAICPRPAFLEPASIHLIEDHSTARVILLIKRIPAVVMGSATNHLDVGMRIKGRIPRQATGDFHATSEVIVEITAGYSNMVETRLLAADENTENSEASHLDIFKPHMLQSSEFIQAIVKEDAVADVIAGTVAQHRQIADGDPSCVFDGDAGFTTCQQLGVTNSKRRNGHRRVALASTILSQTEIATKVLVGLEENLVARSKRTRIDSGDGAPSGLR